VNGREIVSEVMRTRMYPELILDLELRLMAEADTNEPPTWTPMHGGMWLVEARS
jgi:hypothetical protein